MDVATAVPTRATTATTGGDDGGGKGDGGWSNSGDGESFDVGSGDDLSWKCRRFRCRPQLVLKTCLRVFPTRRTDTADVSATSCDVGFFFSVSYVVSLPNCRHVVVVTTTTYHTHLV